MLSAGFWMTFVGFGYHVVDMEPGAQVAGGSSFEMDGAIVVRGCFYPGSRRMISSLVALCRG